MISDVAMGDGESPGFRASGEELMSESKAVPDPCNGRLDLLTHGDWSTTPEMSFSGSSTGFPDSRSSLLAYISVLHNLSASVSIPTAA